MKGAENIAFYSLSKEAACAKLETNSANGLNQTEAEQRLDEFGRNEIQATESRSALAILWSQFSNPMVLLLLGASVLSWWFGEWMDAAAIACVLLLNGVIGFYMEYQAQQSMAALRKLSAVIVKVLRDSQLIQLDSALLVPGDIVFVEAGDMIPADGRIVNSYQLQADESILTGESIPAEKADAEIGDDTLLSDRTNMLFKGTHISRGNAYFVVTATGMQTELGRVAHLVQAAESSATPLEEKLEQFTKKLIRITVVLVIIIFIAGLINGRPFTRMLETSIALAVAAIPEGLPIVATLALAQGMLKMARHRVIVKKLSAVETLGGTSIICADKTGTLTQNKIEVAEVVLASGNARARLLEACVLCNTAELFSSGNDKKSLGDPLEIALLAYAERESLSIQSMRARFPKRSEEPFSSETKIMATLHAGTNGPVVYVKGAAEELLLRCDRLEGDYKQVEMTQDVRREWIMKAQQLASSGMRVIAAAYKTEHSAGVTLSSGLVFTGLICMIDPPRPEVSQAVKECRDAGIRVVMITGDHPATAANIASQLNIGAPSPLVIAGREMHEVEQLSNDEKSRWLKASVFARVTPQQKLDIIRVLQEDGNVVAMTGDGINDAPALKKADIGIAMGERGTQVAQDVAAMVIQDDSFSSIVVAVKQGRAIFDNIRKFVIYLLSCNLSELLVISVSSIFNLHFQLFPLQILFINLVTDVLPALALGVSGASPRIMSHKPRNIGDAIIDRRRWNMIFFYAAILAATSIGAVYFSHNIVHKSESWNRDLCNNILFFTLIFGQLFHVFNMSSVATRFFSSEVFRNKYVWIAFVLSVMTVVTSYFIPVVRHALSLYEMFAADWLVAVTFSISGLIIIQLIRKITRSRI